MCFAQSLATPKNWMLLKIKLITFITHTKPNNCFYVVLISCASEYERYYISPLNFYAL